MVTIEQIRLHCRIDGNEEDALLEQYRYAAMETVKTQTGRNWYAEGVEIPPDDEDGLRITPQINQAMLMLIGGWYENRESSAGGGEITGAFWHLIQPYRIYGV